ncbi:host attachment protein [Ectothiorhodospiraceae bacterium WFHF3C12]|nr:host attachment protein [Ectothiorhodospiraceae bacterium WFHF3C12]
MSDYCVVVAEGARARFFTLEPVEVPEFESGPNLKEWNTLMNPEHKAHQREVYTDVRSGRNRGNAGEAHAYDDHRDQHDAEMEHRFARTIAGELEQFAGEHSASRVVLCAEKQMLGYLRGALNGHARKDLAITEVAKDLTRLSPRDLHEKLARDGVLPKRRERQT